MKKSKKPETLILMRNKLNQDTMYTSPSWPSKEIDGVQFIAIKFSPEDQFAKWMRKDNLEKVKNEKVYSRNN